MRCGAALSLLFRAFLVLPPSSSFAVKGDKCAFLPAVPWCGAAVALLQVVNHDVGINLGGIDRAMT